ncbi:MAG: hypothetical protein IJN40_02500 [Clostridia bacterium]|nr:hypothetical protein [Clostridia bacterium]
MLKKIRTTLYGKLQELDCSYFDKTRKGDIMSRLAMDTDAIRILMSSTYQSLMDQCFFIAV